MNLLTKMTSFIVFPTATNEDLAGMFNSFSSIFAQKEISLPSSFISLALQSISLKFKVQMESAFPSSVSAPVFDSICNLLSSILQNRIVDLILNPIAASLTEVVNLLLLSLQNEGAGLPLQSAQRFSSLLQILISLNERDLGSYFYIHSFLALFSKIESRSSISHETRYALIFSIYGLMDCLDDVQREKLFYSHAIPAEQEAFSRIYEEFKAEFQDNYLRAI